MTRPLVARGQSMPAQPPPQGMSASTALQVSNNLKPICFSNWDEWMLVRQGLYSSAASEQREALRLVSMWRQRRDVPHSVESTANFVEIKLKDPHFALQHTADDASSPSSSSSSSQSSLVMLYSIAVIRAVNGLVDPGQQSFFAQSVLSLAERLGIPGWIVELRHDGTHKALPSISVLRAAAQYMLDWYDKHYWAVQMHNLQGLMRFSLSPVLLAKEETEKEREQWTQQLVKFSASPGFTSDIFLPIFVDAVLGASMSTTTEKGEDTDSLLESTKRVWLTTIEALLSAHGAVWLFSAISRLLHSLERVVIDGVKEEEILRQTELITAWVSFFVERLERALQKHFSSSLAAARVQFIRTQWRRAKEVLQSRVNMLSKLDKALTVFFSNFEQKDKAILESSASSKKKKRPRDEEKLAPTEEDVCFPTVSYSQLDKEPLNEIVFCENFPVWPIGFLPGRYDCSDLLDVEIVVD